MSSGYSSRTWTCPFFQWDEKRKIHCEGGSCMAFPDRDSEAEYVDRFCAVQYDGWKNCSIAASLIRYYERTE